MSVPVVENVTIPIDHLDFEVQCEGFLLEDETYKECLNTALFLVIYSCGCQSSKCLTCVQDLRRFISDHIYSGTAIGICMGCNMLRDDREVIVRPL